LTRETDHYLCKKDAGSYLTDGEQVMERIVDAYLLNQYHIPVPFGVDLTSHRIIREVYAGIKSIPVISTKT